MDSLPVLVVVGHFRNDTSQEMQLFLEPTCEEVHLGPGHAIDLLAPPEKGLLPLTIVKFEDGWEVYPDRLVMVDWHIRYKGQIVAAGYPTRVADFEESPGLVALFKGTVQELPT